MDPVVGSMASPGLLTLAIAAALLLILLVAGGVALVIGLGPRSEGE